MSSETLERWLLPTAVLLYLMSIMLPMRFEVGSLALSLNRLFLILTIIPLGLNLLSGKYGRLIATDYLFGLFFIWSSLAVAVNNPSRAIEQTGSFGVEFLGGYILGRVLVRTPQAFMGVVLAVGICVLCALPFAIHEALTGQTLLLDILASLPGINPPANVVIEGRMGLDRAQVMMPHPILFGLFCSTAFSLVLVGLKGVIGDTKRFLIAGAALTCVFLSLSSGALLSVLFQIFLLIWAAAFDKNKKRWLILVAFFVVLYVAIDLASTRTPIRVFMSYATFSAHNAFWRATIFEWGMMNVRNNPIFGLGLRNWIRPHFMPSASVDNFWLLMAMRNGIPGFLFIASGFALMLWRVSWAQLTEHTRVWRLRRAWMFTMLGVSFTLATVHIWETAFSYIFFLLGAGAWFMSYQEPEDGAEAAESGGDAKRRTQYRREVAALTARPQPPPPPARAAPTRTPPSRTEPTQTAKEKKSPAYTRFEPNGGSSPSRKP